MSTIYMVRTNPMPGREKEFNEWYEAHFREVVELCGFKWGRRGVVDDVQQYPDQPHSYVAFYETDLPPQEFMARMKNAPWKTPIDPTVIDLNNTLTTVYRPISEYHAVSER